MTGSHIVSVVIFYIGKIKVSIQTETFGAFFAFGRVEVIEVGRRLFIGLLLAILLPAGCASPDRSGAPLAEPAVSGHGAAAAEMADIAGDKGPARTADRAARPMAAPGVEKEAKGESHDKAPSLENEEDPKETVEEWPAQLSGEGEDERLSVRIVAELEADREQYKTAIVFNNKADSALSILYDCGLPISKDGFAPKTGICPAVESMLLKGGGQEALTVTLPADFFHMEERLITVRYREGNVMHELLIGMRGG